MFNKKTKSIIISYVTLRNLIGFLGIALPFICIAGGFLFAGVPILMSISHYYHVNMRDFFVGLLCGVSLFLVTYKGYQQIDNIVTTASGAAGFGIAIFPCLNTPSAVDPVGLLRLNPVLSGYIHLSCAALFFILLACNSMFLFTKSDKEKTAWSRRKIARNRIFIGCGVVILGSLLAVAALNFVTTLEFQEKTRLILILETIMLTAFGTSWLVKGRLLMPDKVEKAEEKVSKAS